MERTEVENEKGAKKNEKVASTGNKLSQGG